MAAYDPEDAFRKRARREGFRSRAAYKLAWVQKNRRLLRRGQRVADLGCWPGSWLQVASQAVGPSGRVVGIDRVETEPLNNANTIALCMDLADPELIPRVREALGGPADVILSDAAPRLTGIRPTDRAHEEALLETIESLIPALLAPGGSLLLKILESPEAQGVERRIRGLFDRARSLRPEASRRGSTERYCLATGFRGGERAE